MPDVKQLFQRFTTMLTKPISELTTPELLEVMTSPDKDELAREIEVLKARRYHDGLQAAVLTDRLKMFLGNEVFTLNFSAMVDRAVSERLSFKEMECVRSQGQTLEDVESLNQVAWFTEWWRANRLGFHQATMHKAAVSQGEYFAIIDFDDANNRARITPHKRYVSEAAGGDGMGVLMVYPDNNISQKPLYALKRWRDIVNKKPVDKIAVYGDDRVIVFQKNAMGWMVIDEVSLLNPRTGKPLGIPVVHWKTPDLMPEAKEAWGTQRLLLKLLTDLIIESDQNAFRIYKFFGFNPNDKNGNPPIVAPGSMVGSSQVSPSEASFEAIASADLATQDKTIDSFILKMAQLTDTPASRFQTTNQIAAEGTLKQQEAPLLKKCGVRAEGFAIAWEDAATIARRWHNAYANFATSDFGFLDESRIFDFKWQPFYNETSADKLADAQVETQTINNVVLKINAKIIPVKQARLESGYSEDQSTEFANEIESEASSANDTLARALNSGAFGG